VNFEQQFQEAIADSLERWVIRLRALLRQVVNEPEAWARLSESLRAEILKELAQGGPRE